MSLFPVLLPNFEYVFMSLSCPSTLPPLLIVFQIHYFFLHQKFSYLHSTQVFITKTTFVHFVLICVAVSELPCSWLFVKKSSDRCKLIKDPLLVVGAGDTIAYHLFQASRLTWWRWQPTSGTAWFTVSCHRGPVLWRCRLSRPPQICVGLVNRATDSAVQSLVFFLSLFLFFKMLRQFFLFSSCPHLCLFASVFFFYAMCLGWVWFRRYSTIYIVTMTHLQRLEEFKLQFVSLLSAFVIIYSALCAFSFWWFRFWTNASDFLPAFCAKIDVMQGGNSMILFRHDNKKWRKSRL